MTDPHLKDVEHVRSNDGKQNFARYMIGGLCLILFLALTGVGYVQVEERRGGGLRPFVSAENKKCIDCHTAKDVGVGGINDWKVSRHAPKGIGCVECHRAEKGEPDAYDHEGFLISTLVTPKDCMRCHDREAKEFAKSHHAKAAQFTGSLDNFLGNVVEGPEIVTTGCAGCRSRGAETPNAPRQWWQWGVLGGLALAGLAGAAFYVTRQRNVNG